MICEVKTMINLTLYGRPITKKNSSRVVRCGNYTKVLPSKQFELYQKDCLRQITGDKRLKLNTPCNMCCVYYMPTRGRVDLVNLLEATCDILVKAGVIDDDNCSIVASHDGSKVCYDKVNPRVEICIEEVRV